MPTNDQIQPESGSLKVIKDLEPKIPDPKSSLYEVLGGCSANGFAMPSIIRKSA